MRKENKCFVEPTKLGVFKEITSSHSELFILLFLFVLTENQFAINFCGVIQHGIKLYLWRVPENQWILRLYKTLPHAIQRHLLPLLLSKPTIFRCSSVSLNHINAIVWLAGTVLRWFSDSVCNTLSLHGHFSHQIKHLNNYCLIYCCGRRACGLIMTRLERETEASTTHFSLLIVSPSGPQVTLTVLQTLERRTQW